jgi:hypothetical protein
VRWHKPSPATAIACLALLVALGGTALAANHYVISRTSQIKPSVLRALIAPGPEITIASPKPTPVIPAGKHISELRVECPRGYHSVSGGYFGELAPGAYVASSEPELATAWSVIVNSERATRPSEMIVKVLCAPGAVSVK